MKRLILLLAFCAPAAVLAAEPPALSPAHEAAFAAVLPPAALVEQALDDHPQVREAEAGLAAAQAERTRLSVGSHEYVASALVQGRRDDADRRQFVEGELELSRTLRSGAKARLDRQAGAIGAEAAANGIADARHEAARLLADLWFAWIEADAVAALDRRTAEALEREAAALRRRVELKDAAQLELDLAAAALAAAEARLAQAEGEARAAALALSRRYPELPLPARPPALPEPVELEAPGAVWRDLVLARSHEILIAEQGAQRLRALAARARLDRRPDPTVGVRLFSERGGREHGVGLFVSRPLGGTYRSATVELEGARAAGAEAAARQVRREVAETAERDVAAVETGLIAWRAAQVSARAAQAAADRTRRAFELGERDIADSLQVQRQGLEAQRAEIAARAAAWRALALLRIDAHDLWAEQHED